MKKIILILGVFLSSCMGTSKSINWYTFDEGIAASISLKRHIIYYFCSGDNEFRINDSLMINEFNQSYFNANFIPIKILLDKDSIITDYDTKLTNFELALYFRIEKLPSIVFTNCTADSSIIKLSGFTRHDSIFRYMMEYIGNHIYINGITFEEYARYRLIIDTKILEQ